MSGAILQVSRERIRANAGMLEDVILGDDRQKFSTACTRDLKPQDEMARLRDLEAEVLGGHGAGLHHIASAQLFSEDGSFGIESRCRVNVYDFHYHPPNIDWRSIYENSNTYMLRELILPALPFEPTEN